MTVYIVYCNYDYEGSDVMSVHATKAGANAEAKRLSGITFEPYISYGVEAKEVLP